MRIAKQLIVALLLGLIPAAGGHAASHDGHWTFLVITEKGECDQAYRYEVSVANGQVQYAGEAAVGVSGTVTPDGAVRVSIKLGEKGANGNGRLSASTGTGTWRGIGPNASCSGRWEAEKR